VTVIDREWTPVDCSTHAVRQQQRISRRTCVTPVVTYVLLKRTTVLLLMRLWLDARTYSVELPVAILSKLWRSWRLHFVVAQKQIHRILHSATDTNTDLISLPFLIISKFIWKISRIHCFM